MIPVGTTACRCSWLSRHKIVEGRDERFGGATVFVDQAYTVVAAESNKIECLPHFSFNGCRGGSDELSVRYLTATILYDFVAQAF